MDEPSNIGAVNLENNSNNIILLKFLIIANGVISISEEYKNQRLGKIPIIINF